MSRTNRDIPHNRSLRRPSHLNTFKEEKRLADEMAELGFEPSNRQKTVRARKPTDWDDQYISGHDENRTYK